MSVHGTFRTWRRWPAMSAVGGTAEVVARLVAIIEGWLDSLIASPKIALGAMRTLAKAAMSEPATRHAADGCRARSVQQICCCCAVRKIRPCYAASLVAIALRMSLTNSR